MPTARRMRMASPSSVPVDLSVVAAKATTVVADTQDIQLLTDREEVPAVVQEARRGRKRKASPPPTLPVHVNLTPTSAAPDQPAGINVSLLAPVEARRTRRPPTKKRQTAMPRDRKVLLRRPDLDSPWACTQVADEKKLRQLMAPLPHDSASVWREGDVRCMSSSSWRHGVLGFYGPAVEEVRTRFGLITDTSGDTTFVILAVNLCPGKEARPHVIDYVKRYCIHPMYVDPARPINDNIYRRGTHVLAVLNALLCLDERVPADARARFLYTMTLGDRGHAALGGLIDTATGGAVRLSATADGRVHRLAHVLYVAVILECARFAKCAVPMKRFSATHIDIGHVEHMVDGARALDQFDKMPSFDMTAWYEYYGVDDRGSSDKDMDKEKQTGRGGGGNTTPRDDKQPLNAVCLHLMALAFVSVATADDRVHMPLLPDDYTFVAGQGPSWVPASYLAAIQETISVRRKDMTALTRVAATALVSLLMRVPATGDGGPITYEALRQHVCSGGHVCARQYMPFMGSVADRLRPVLDAGVMAPPTDAYTSCLRVLARHALRPAPTVVSV